MNTTKGMTLAETMLVVGIASVVLVMGVFQTQHSRARTGSRAEAEVVAEKIRSLRQLAVSSQTPVALVMPTSGGTQPFSQSFYVLTGATAPKETEILNLAGDFPETYAVQSFWALDPTALTDPSHTNSVANPALGLQGADFDSAAWGLPQPSDYALIFLPSGAVTSNGLPQFDQNFHLVFCHSFLASAAAAPPGPATSLNYFEMTGAADPYTLTITPTGQVQVFNGILAAAASVTAQGSQPSSLPQPPPRTLGTNHQPVILGSDVVVKPTYDPALLTGSATWGCQLGGHIVISFKANDEDGDALFCRWLPTTGGTYSATAGQFSTSAVEWQPMRFREGSWQAECCWRPPDTATGGQIFDLDCEVSDRRGPSVHLSGGVITWMRPQVRDSATIWCMDATSFYKVTGDGVIVKEVPLPTALGGICIGSVSRNGQHLAASYWGYNLIQWNADGSNPTLLPHISAGNQECDPDISLGGQMCYWANFTTWVSNFDGSNPHQVTFPGPSEQDHAALWSADGTRITFVRSTVVGGVNTDFHVMVVNRDGTGLQDLGLGWAPSFSPDDSTVMFRQADGIYTRPTDGSAPATKIIDAPSSDNCFWLHLNAWTSDGSEVVYLDNSLAPRICRPDGSGDRPLGTFTYLKGVRPSW